MKIVHLTSAHARYDTRIFHKMCMSSVEAGHEVSLIVADGSGYEEVCGVRIYDVGRPKNRLDRFSRISFKLILFSKRIESDLFQLHDPELLLYLPFLKRCSKIIFDFHEDVATQILRKEYLNGFARRYLAFGYKLCERVAMFKINGIVSATDHISNIYRNRKPTQTVCNFPIISEFQNSEFRPAPKVYSGLVYVGGISEGRGLGQLVDALEMLDERVSLHLCGPFSSFEFECLLKSKRGWEKVQYHGSIDRKSVVRVLEDADLGVVTLLPDPGYAESLPIKMFEYFAAGLPVVASNFPLWTDILESNKCGETVDPCNPEKIAKVIGDLLEDPIKMQALGRNGYQASIKKFRWNLEYEKLEKFYNIVVGTV